MLSCDKYRSLVRAKVRAVYHPLRPGDVKEKGQSQEGTPQEKRSIHPFGNGKNRFFEIADSYANIVQKNLYHGQPAGLDLGPRPGRQMKIQMKPCPEKIIGPVEYASGNGQTHRCRSSRHQTCYDHPFQKGGNKKIGRNEIERKGMKIIEHHRNGEHLGCCGQSHPFLHPSGQEGNP